ncbi:MAG TPA: energy transducer TonB [Candidatus Acidoferrum sp.]|nr:energy transducer TonB [Candidatus Acidoferrum sp.]
MKLNRVALCLAVFCTSGLVAKQDPSKLEAGKRSQTAPAAQERQPHRIRVNEAVQEAKLVHQVSPLYPPLLGKRMDGTVVLGVIVGQNGAVKSARYVSGLANLKDSAIRAVLQWRYKPTLVNGAPVEVDTTVSVVFPRLATQRQSASNE